MFKLAGVFLASMLFVSNPFVFQSGDTYVRTTRIVPNLSSSGWRHDTVNDRVTGNGITTEAYVNDSQGLQALMQVQTVNGSRQEQLMKFGTTNVARAAIKVDGVWYIAEGIFYDHPNRNPENDFKAERVPNTTQGSTGTSVKVTLNTLEGPKSLVLNLQ